MGLVSWELAYLWSASLDPNLPTASKGANLMFDVDNCLKKSDSLVPSSFIVGYEEKKQGKKMSVPIGM